MRILGIDPGLRHTGWGLIDQDGSRLSYVADGTISTGGKAPMEERLLTLNAGLISVIKNYEPNEAAIEETFVNQNPAAALKLGMARGVVFMTPAQVGLKVSEYAANVIKKTVVGSGHASKEQIMMMVKTLLPKADPHSADSADALAIAICHSSHRGINRLRSQIKSENSKAGAA